MHASLLPVRHCPRRASLVKAICDRRTAGHRGKMHGARTREDGLDKPGAKFAEFAPIGSREGYGQTLKHFAPGYALQSRMQPRRRTAADGGYRGSHR